MAYTTIDDPSAHFQVKTYTGTSGIHDVTLDGNSDMQPDWVWIKDRGESSAHEVFDVVRGVTKTIQTKYGKHTINTITVNFYETNR